MIEGSFIVVEGIDGAGTTTQSELLAEWFRGRGLPEHITHEPTDGPVGSMIRQVLTNRLVVRGSRGLALRLGPRWRYCLPPTGSIISRARLCPICSTE